MLNLTNITNTINDAPTVAQPKSQVGYCPDIPLTKSRSDEVRFDRLLDDLECSIEMEPKDASHMDSEDRIEDDYEADNYFDSADSVFGSEV